MLRFAISACILAFIAAFGWWRSTLPARQRAQTLDALERQLSADGGVARDDAELRLEQGAARLQVSLFEVESKSVMTTAHVHIVANVARSPLDFCLLGVGASLQTATDEAVSVFIHAGLPVALAAGSIRAQGTKPFSGSQPWGVPSRRGFLGPVFARGASTSTIDASEAQLFAGLPELPDDSRLHLLKAVLLRTERGWERTIEVDGQRLVSEEPFVFVMKGDAEMLIQFATVVKRDNKGNDVARSIALEQLKTRPVGAACSLDALPFAFSEEPFDFEACAAAKRFMQPAEK